MALATLKTKVKERVQRNQRLWRIYQDIKGQARRLRAMSYFVYDMRSCFRWMHWSPGRCERTPLSAELLFQYHKLEKGMSMPGERRFFGAAPAVATVRLAQRWIAKGHPRNDPVFVGALETLSSYACRAQSQPGLEAASIAESVSQFLSKVPEREPALITPQRLPSLQALQERGSAAIFGDIARARRSVRQFATRAVSDELLSECVQAAQLAPSACNRQPWRVYVVDNPVKRKELLSLQNGNRGFGHTASRILVLTSDERCFFDASERHEPYIDGGLFAMSLVLALTANGVGSCCLNWCVPPSADLAAHSVVGITPSERIIMLIAIGYPLDQCEVPRSPRRAVDDVLVRVQ